jgi:hypothetical protein
MSARLRRVRNVIVLIVPVALASCDSQPTMLSNSAITRPSNVSSPPPPNGFNISPALMPPTIPFHILPVFGCPSASPFETRFSLVIDQRDGIDVSMHEVDFRFIDGSGFESPLILGERDLAALFGSTLVVGGTSRTFPFQPRFGCGLSSTPRLMVMRLLLFDRHGRSHERMLTAHAER